MRAGLMGLTTRGRCLLAAGVAAALCSVILDERDLLRVAIFVFAFPVLCAVMVARARVRLSAHRVLIPTRLPVGESGQAQLWLRSTGRIPSGGLLLEDGVPHAVGNRPRFVIERLTRRTHVELRYPLCPAARGVHQLGPLNVRFTDPFGLIEYDRELAGHSQLLALPRTERLTGLPLGSGVGIGEDGVVRLRSGHGTDDAVVRPYRHGDDLRRVHWRSTAHRDELMVRVEESPWHGGTTVLLDHRADAHRGNDTSSSLEWAISFAASVCLHLGRAGHRYRLVLEDGEGPSGLNVGGGDNDSMGRGEGDILDALAALHPSHHRELAYQGDPGAGQELVAVFGSLGPIATAELVRFRPRALHSHAVLLDVSAWSGHPMPANGGRSSQETTSVADAAGILRSAGWSVIIVQPQETVASAWRRLCARDPSLEPLLSPGRR